MSENDAKNGKKVVEKKPEPPKPDTKLKTYVELGDDW